MSFWADRSIFAKIVIILAVAFGVGLGLCGLSNILPSSDTEFHTNWLGTLSLLVIVISFLGLIITLIAWIIAAVVGNFPGKPWGGADSLWKSRRKTSRQGPRGVTRSSKETEQVTGKKDV